MTTDVRILARDDATDRHAYPILLLKTYGIAAHVHSIRTAFAVDAPDTIWLALDRREVPTLALLSGAWSTDLLGGLANIADATGIRDVLAGVGLQSSAGPAGGAVEGYVWNGAFRPAVIHGASLDRTALVESCQRVCTRLSVARSYLRIDFDDLDAIVDVSPVPGDAMMISRARLAGFCPLWTSYCIASGTDPVMPLLDAGSIAEHTPS